ncbi:MAG: methyltransferase domain-containing protein [Candidatus Dadabacteria bacterium]|nr:methyltransferase domain-containing protein [Candidatus Dadabacteria bacterium]
MSVKKIVAIVGDANIDDDASGKREFAYETGRLLVEAGYSVATGGLGGVMECASEGARAARNHTEGSVIGVLPGYDPRVANPHLDIAIPTGQGIGRNLTLISMSSAVIAIGGGSGTLSEIAFAWQMGKLIIAATVGGSSGDMAGKSLDRRRSDSILPASSAGDAVKLVSRHIDRYADNTFGGVREERISRKAAAELILSYGEGVDGEPEYLGRGGEGLVFRDSRSVFKVFDGVSNLLELHWQLSALAERMRATPPEHIQPVSAVKVCEGSRILIQGPFLESTGLLETAEVPDMEYIRMLREFKRLGWICSDLQPENLRILKSGALALTDIGHSLFPFSRYLFESMCRRAFVISRLHGKLRNGAEFKRHLTAVNERADFSSLAESGFVSEELSGEFEQFHELAEATATNEVLNPALQALFREHVDAGTVLDYGSGHGEHAQMLLRMGMEVSAYEPDGEILEKYRERNYAGVRILERGNLDEMKVGGAAFDTVLCSLVLCYELGDSPESHVAEMEKIMEDLTALSRGRVVIAICNPLYTGQPESPIQQRHVSADFGYLGEHTYTKLLRDTGRRMVHTHRPLSFYEDLFRRHRLEVNRIVQTADPTGYAGVRNSDFMVFLLSKV